MPQIGSFVQGIYRDESRYTAELVAALCQAALEYLPVELDEEGYRNGRSYKYASIHSIRRATLSANSKHGLLLNHVYGENDKGEYVTSVLRHTSGEYMASTSPLPRREDVQDAKAAKTLLCRTHIEGLLGIVTERDTDGAVEDTVSDEQRGLWATTWMAARAAIRTAHSLEAVDKYEATAMKRVSEGGLAPDITPEIERLCNERRDFLKEAIANDERAGTVSSEEPNAAGGGDSQSNRRTGRGAVGVG
jgi:hypothetical protein